MGRETAAASRKRQAIQADAGSPLAWDNSLRVLWFVRYGALASARWTGTTFNTTEQTASIPSPSGGLFVDSGLHFVYFLNAAKQPVCYRKKAGSG
jgi:hypothetical protein